MSNVIYDLAAERNFAGGPRTLVHPAGVKLPFDSQYHAEMLTPQLRAQIVDGSYSADVIRLLPEALAPGDRVLVIGAGLGVVSTLIAKSGLAERIVAIEPNVELIPYIEHVKELNDTPEIETVCGVLAHGRRGTVPFFVDSDLRNSALTPNQDSWRRVMRVPFLDMNLILAEERISLIVSDVPSIETPLFTGAELSRVPRLLMHLTEERLECWEEGGLCVSLAAQGYLSPPRPSNQRATIFRRAKLGHGIL